MNSKITLYERRHERMKKKESSQTYHEGTKASRTEEREAQMRAQSMAKRFWRKKK